MTINSPPNASIAAMASSSDLAFNAWPLCQSFYLERFAQHHTKTAYQIRPGRPDQTPSTANSSIKVVFSRRFRTFRQRTSTHLAALHAGTIHASFAVLIDG
jgi:hypothetical protein